MTFFTNNYTSLYHINIIYCIFYGIFLDKYKITAILKVETDIIVNISASRKDKAQIFVLTSVMAFRTNVIVLSVTS